MEAPFAALLKLEMLDRVGDVHAGTVDPGVAECAVEHLPGRADKRPAGKILLVAGLLADRDHRRVGRSFAEHRLRRVPVERAAGAASRLVAQRVPG